MPIRLPDDSSRCAILGATGSGKTVAELWHISNKDIETRAHLIYNFKRDQNIDGIPHARHIGMDEIPIRPGLYIVHPGPNDGDDVEKQMWEIWRRGGIGVHIDEGYMIGKNNGAFRALLTQGRSLKIPMTILSQRPVWMDRFVLSESEFFQVFRLQHRKDRATVQEFIPDEHNISERLPEYHSYYYDVGRNEMTPLSPVPSMEDIYKVFDKRLKRVRKTV